MNASGEPRMDLEKLRPAPGDIQRRCWTLYMHPDGNGQCVLFNGHDCDHVFAASQPETLDAAWKEAEAALPEGWIIGQLRRALGMVAGKAEPSRWAAVAWPKSGYDVTSYGPTPAAALQALATRLKEGNGQASNRIRCDRAALEACPSGCGAFDWRASSNGRSVLAVAGTPRWRWVRDHLPRWPELPGASTDLRVGKGQGSRWARTGSAAEEGALWQDEWDNHTSDGSAWENFVQTFDPRTVLEMLDALAAGPGKPEWSPDYSRGYSDGYNDGLQHPAATPDHTVVGEERRCEVDHLRTALTRTFPSVRGWLDPDKNTTDYARVVADEYDRLVRDAASDRATPRPR